MTLAIVIAGEGATGTTSGGVARLVVNEEIEDKSHLEVVDPSTEPRLGLSVEDYWAAIHDMGLIRKTNDSALESQVRTVKIALIRSSSSKHDVPTGSFFSSPSAYHGLSGPLARQILEAPQETPLEGYEKYSVANWDGYDAQPITPETLQYARQLLRVMPNVFGPADIAPSGDGSIGLEWVPETGPLHKLFLDIGPGESWRAYWKRRTGESGRQEGISFNTNTQKILQELFRDLSA
jgi:hypothetical protein